MSKKVSFHITNAKSNVPTVQAVIDNKPAIYLHSMIDPYHEANEWVKRVELLPSTLYIVLGAGLGYHLKALLDQLPKHSFIMVLYTQDEIQLLKFISERPDGKWLFDKRMQSLPLINLYDMSIVIGDIMIDKVIKKIHICRYFPTMSLAEQEYQRIENDLVPEIEKSMAINFNIRFHTNYKFFENYWNNFPSIVVNPGVKSFIDAFANVPVIIVAGGPSLNKNIQELKKCADKAVIIAAGSTLGALYKHGIKPHCLVVTDATPLMYEDVKDFFSPDTLLVASTTVQYRIVEEYPGPICFMNTKADLAGEIRKYLPENIIIKQTMSVSTAAVDFANVCGARRIILVGQDLSFPDSNQQHADGIHTQGYKQFMGLKIPGYFGGEVDSVPIFKTVVSYYNQYVIENPHIQFINATEGGAMIAAMRNLPLSDVHQQLLIDDVDIEKIIKLHYDKENNLIEYPRILKYLYTMRGRCEKLINVINRFCKKENILLDNVDKKVVLDQSMFGLFEKLYAIIVKHGAYQYIQSVIELRLSLLKFQMEEQMPLEMQYQYYINMTLGLQEVIVNLISWTDKNIIYIKNIHTEVDDEK